MQIVNGMLLSLAIPGIVLLGDVFKYEKKKEKLVLVYLRPV